MREFIAILLSVCCCILLGVAGYMKIIGDPRVETPEACVFITIVAVATIVAIIHADEK